MLLTADIVLAHLVGDYWLQSDWMASEKVRDSTAAFVHAFTYTLPFLFVTQSLDALAVVMISHFVIDRWRLAKRLCWLKNFIAPQWINAGGRWLRNYPWSECSITGYHKSKDFGLAVFLLIAADNTIHLLLNAIAIKYL